MITVFEQAWLKGIFGDDEAEALWSSEAQLGHYLAFESALALALEKTRRVPAGYGVDAAHAIGNTSIDIDSLARGTARDGLPIPDLVRQLRDQAGQAKEAVHTGATSQDVLDTALALTLRDLSDLMLKRLNVLDIALRDLCETHGYKHLMGRTRMQAALPISVADRLMAWQAPLADHAEAISALRPSVEKPQLGGAVGNRSAFGGSAEEIANMMSETLGLSPGNGVWHTDRTGLAVYAGQLSLITGTLGKMGQDIALMAQQGIGEIKLSGGGGSSAMPHKANPVQAELLVTLARFNATLLSGMHQALVHEQERSGAAWMLEWMTLPQMTMSSCLSLKVAHRICQQIEDLGSEGNA